jgi:hypothetical protein
MEDLKLVALDQDDIEVVSAHVQDALVRVGDIFWQPREHRFVMALNRFDWMNAGDSKDFQTKDFQTKDFQTKDFQTKDFQTKDFQTKDLQAPDYRRCRTALRFERVLSCKCRDLSQADKNARLNLLAVEFAAGEAPAGTVLLTFSGGGVIRLEVECLEAELVDLGEVFAAALCPDHFGAEPKTA